MLTAKQREWVSYIVGNAYYDILDTEDAIIFLSHLSASHRIEIDMSRDKVRVFCAGKAGSSSGLRDATLDLINQLCSPPDPDQDAVDQLLHALAGDWPTKDEQIQAASVRSEIDAREFLANV